MTVTNAPNLPSRCIEQTPLPMAIVEGATHVLSYVNPAFCRLTQKTEQELLGKCFGEILTDRPQCLALLDRVYRSAKSESHAEQENTGSGAVFWSYTGWPMIADAPTLGVMIQRQDAPPIYTNTLAVNEALVIGALRQHELTTAAILTNQQLRSEASEQKQRALDARMLTNEIAHRIKNNLQIVAALISYEVKRANSACAQGYQAMQARIMAIAELYDLVSQSSHDQTVALDAYLTEIANATSASALGTASGVKIQVRAETVHIDPDRAVPFGLLVNELTTNAIKHAFPDGKGSVVLGLRQTGDQVELDVSDNGVGIKDDDPAQTVGTHGADYIAIFVRQLGGTLDLLGSDGAGTTVRIRFPTHMDR